MERTTKPSGKPASGKQLKESGSKETTKSSATKGANSDASPAKVSVTSSHAKGLGEHRVLGGKVTAYIEEQTGKLPWVSWIGLAALSVGASVVFAATPRARGFAACAGTLAPCFLMVGLYNKLISFERSEIQQHLKLLEPHVEVPSGTSYLS